MMPYAHTEEASYVHGMDMTLSGSRSGVNAVAIWMILFTYGPHGWQEKINKLLYRTDVFCKKLNILNLNYYRNPFVNIVAIDAKHIPLELASRHGLVPDDHRNPKWYKIVVMEHVDLDHLFALIDDLRKCQKEATIFN